MHQLDGPRLKVRRAESEIKTLDSLMLALWQDTPYHVVRSEFNPKSGKDVFRVRVKNPPDLSEWGITIGEIAHNLRSALDGLVYQLAYLNTAPNAPTGTQFPIFLTGRTSRKSSGKTTSNFDRGGRRYIRSLRPDHQAYIERLQPYKRGRGGQSNPLWLLSQINNADKHRLIQVVAAKWGAGPSVAGTGTGDTFDYPFMGLRRRILNHGAKFGEAAPGVHVSSDVYPLLVFWNGCDAVKGKPVVFLLSRIAEHVSQIVESFAPEFA